MARAGLAVVGRQPGYGWENIASARALATLMLPATFGAQVHKEVCVGS